MPERLPSYRELPGGSSWGVWPGGERFGCLNLLTAQRAAAAAALVHRGAVFALNWSMRLPDPPLYGRARFEHEITNPPSGSHHDDVLHGWNTQSSSQWDGLRHVPHPRLGFYGGLPGEEHGVDHWAQRGLAGRAVLCDVGAWRAAVGRPLRYDEPDPIEVSDLEAALAAQGTAVGEGDVLLVRTGWISWYEGLSAAERVALAEPGALRTPGLAPTQDTVAFLWDLHIAALGADNPAVEVWPIGALRPAEEVAAIRADRSRFGEIFIHVHLLALLGLPLGEMWYLDALAADCRADGRYEGFFVSAPLNLPSGVASPPNALVLK